MLDKSIINKTIELLKQGYSQKEIRSQVQISTFSIAKIAKDYNINISADIKFIHKYNTLGITKDVIKKEFKKFGNQKDTAKKLGVGIPVISKLLKLHNISNYKLRTTQKITDVEYIEKYHKLGITRDLIKNDIDMGLSTRKIAKKYNISSPTAKKLINVYNLNIQDGRINNLSDSEYIEKYRKLGITHNVLQKYFNQGCCKKEICDTFNISVIILKKLVNLLNVRIPTLAEQRFYQLRQEGWTKLTLDKLREHYTDAEITQRYKLSNPFLNDLDYLLSVPDMKNTVHHEDLLKNGDLTRELVIYLLMKNRCNQFALRDQLTQQFNVYMPRETFRKFLDSLDIPKKYLNSISHDKQMKTILKRFDLTPRKLATEYDNNLNVTIDDIVNRLNSKLEFWEPLFSKQWFMATVLPLSKNERVTAKSREELSFSSAIQAMFPNMQMNTSDRNVISPRELDLYIPELKLGIEFNGDYWHSDKMTKKSHGVSAQKRHQEKLDMCNAAGVHVLFVWEKQWKADKFTVLQAIKDFANTGVIAPMLSVLSDERRESLSELSKQAEFNHAHGIDKNKDKFLTKVRKLKQDIDYSGNRNYNYYMHVLEENNTSLTEFKEIVNSKPKTQIAKDLDLTIHHLNTFIKMLGLN